jgi:hypothetical protein
MRAHTRLMALMGVLVKLRKYFRSYLPNIQGVFESCADILTTSYWLHVELGKNI